MKLNRRTAATTKNLTVIGHLEELRGVLIVTLISIPLMSILCQVVWGDRLFELCTRPLEGYDVTLVYIGMTEAFITKFKVTVMAGFILALPIILWKLWSFLSPALFPHERRFILAALPASLLLFAAGAVFAYLVVLKVVVRFLLIVVGGDLQPMLSVSKYVSFLIGFVMPFGIAFQLPLVVYFLTRVGLLTPEWLGRNRKMAILVMAIIGAVLTPPDVISQILLAGPLIALYELSVLVSKLARPKPRAVVETLET